MPVTFVSEVPPVSGRTAARLMDEAAELKANPGKWALIYQTPLMPEPVKAKTRANSLSTRIRSGSGAFKAKGDYECATRSDTQNVSVYCRYVGK